MLYCIIFYVKLIIVYFMLYCIIFYVILIIKYFMLYCIIFSCTNHQIFYVIPMIFFSCYIVSYFVFYELFLFHVILYYILCYIILYFMPYYIIFYVILIILYSMLFWITNLISFILRNRYNLILIILWFLFLLYWTVQTNLIIEKMNIRNYNCYITSQQKFIIIIIMKSRWQHGLPWLSPSLSFITPGRSSKLHPVSAKSICK